MLTQNPDPIPNTSSRAEPRVQEVSQLESLYKYSLSSQVILQHDNCWRVLHTDRLISLPICSVGRSVDTGWVTPVVRQVHAQQTEGQAQALVQVDGVSQLEPGVAPLTQWQLGKDPPDILEDNLPEASLGRTICYSRRHLV